MSEKRFYLDEEDRLCIHYDGKILAGVGFSETEAKKIVDMLNQLNDENEKLRQQLKEKEEDEQLYANEIVKLNKEAKEVLDFKSLGGDY